MCIVNGDKFKPRKSLCDAIVCVTCEQAMFYCSTDRHLPPFSGSDTSDRMELSQVYPQYDLDYVKSNILAQQGEVFSVLLC